MTVVIRGDWAGFALYLEEPESIEPGECAGLFKTLTGAARARAAADEATEELNRLFGVSARMEGRT